MPSSRQDSQSPKFTHSQQADIILKTVTMSARKNPNRVYTATADELNEAIGLVLKEVRRRGRTAERDEVIDSDR